MNDELYACAIALNNMAVTMLERHCFKQAFVTLKDALCCMREASSSLSSDHHSNFTIKTTNSLQAKLHKAAQRTSRPEIIPLLSTEQPSQPPLRIHAMWDSGGLVGNAFALTLPFLQAEDGNPSNNNNNNSISPQVMQPIRIDESLLLQDERLHDVVTSQESDLTTAIVVYNFGLAHYCRSQTVSASSSSNRHLPTKFRDNALTLLQLCQTILSTNCLFDDDGKDWELFDSKDHENEEQETSQRQEPDEEIHRSYSSDDEGNMNYNDDKNYSSAFLSRLFLVTVLSLQAMTTIWMMGDPNRPCREAAQECQRQLQDVLDQAEAADVWWAAAVQVASQSTSRLPRPDSPDYSLSYFWWYQASTKAAAAA